MLTADSQVSEQSRAFTVDVTRLSCNGGTTGPVPKPVVREDTSRIVVTFTLDAPLPVAQTCPANPPTRYLVKLRDPIGHRQLVDGVCESYPVFANGLLCNGAPAGPVRWSPPAP